MLSITSYHYKGGFVLCNAIEMVAKIVHKSLVMSSLVHQVMSIQVLQLERGLELRVHSKETGHVVPQQLVTCVASSRYMVSCQGDVKICGKNYKQCKSCITVRSLNDPLSIAFTKLKLSHRISTDCQAICGPYAIHLITIDMSSLAMILCKAHYSHCPFMKAPQPSSHKHLYE